MGAGTTTTTEDKIERVAKIVGIVACVWFALVASWGLFGDLGAGHYASKAGIGISADNMLRYRMWGPVWDYLNERPIPQQYYCHHPWGPFWMTAAFMAIFGRHDWVISAPAVVMSIFTPVLLYGMAKQVWGRTAGAAAAVGFVVVPIAIAFANFHNLEDMVIFGWALFFWGHARMLATWKRRHMVASLAGVFVTAAGDWPGYIALGVVLGWSLMRVFFFDPHWVQPARARRYAQWWVWSATIAVLTLCYFVAAFFAADKLNDWLSSAQWRGGGAAMSLEETLKSRAFWIETTFTPFIIAVGKLALPIALVRVVWFRRDEEIYSVATWIAATIQYVQFKGGADVHIFWPHYFAIYFAIAFAQFVVTVVAIWRWVSLRVIPRDARRLSAVFGVAIVALFFVVLIPDGWRTLAYARATGGRFNEKGYFIRSDLDLVHVLKRVVKPRLSEAVGPQLHTPSTGWAWHLGWAVGQHVDGPNTIPNGTGHWILVARASGLNTEAQKEFLSRYAAEIYDDIWVADRRKPPAPLQGFRFAEREPNLVERYLFGGIEPVRTLVSDPFVTWEWRHHFDQQAFVPQIEPTTLEQKRIAHNIAVTAHDAVRAEALQVEIRRELTHPMVAAYKGLRILGWRHIQGVFPRVEVWVQAEGPTEADLVFGVHSNVVAPKRMSFLPVDPGEQDNASPPALSTKLYKPGFLYTYTTVLRHRIGQERYWGFFWARDGKAVPPRIDGGPEHIELLVLP